MSDLAVEVRDSIESNTVQRIALLFNEFVPDRERSVNSDELVPQVMFVGHVAVMTQVIVVTLSTHPANTTHFVLMTTVTTDALVVHT